MDGPALLKPRDKVRTPGGRLAEVLAILPGHERDVRMVDGNREVVRFRESQLELVAAATPKPWRQHTPWEA